jgi:hypothetical protein
MSSNKPTDRFTLLVPEEQEEETVMPDKLEVIDYNPVRKPQKKLGGGAYNPYSNSGSTGDTARTRRPRVDLRKLSEWIKTTQQVETLREDGTTVPKRDKR